METKLFKRVLSLAIVVFMVVSMLPTQVWAENVDMDVEDFYDPSASSDPYYCPACKLVGDWEDVAEGAWNAGGDILGDGRHYRLTGDQNITAALIVAADKTVCIDLNGHNITAPKANNVRVFENKGTLSIYDKVGTGVISGGKVYNSDTSKSSTQKMGGNVYNEGVFNLYGGTISGGIATTSGNYQPIVFGGNLYGAAGSVTNIYGGTITGGDVTKGGSYTNAYIGGGNLCIDGELNIEGGTISGGRVHFDYNNKYENRELKLLGGNIYLRSGAVMNMYDGTVTGGKIDGTRTDSDVTDLSNSEDGATSNGLGGNIYATGATVNIVGGTISNGQIDITVYGAATAELYVADTYTEGGNIYVGNSSTLNITGGTISGGSLTAKAYNHANSISTGSTRTYAYGANVFADSSSVSVTGGTIKEGSITTDSTNSYAGAKAESYGRGAGLFLRDNTSLTLGGKVKILDNTVTARMTAANTAGYNQGGSIYLEGNALELNGTAMVSGGKIDSVHTATSAAAYGNDNKGGNIYFAGADLTISGNASVIGGTLVADNTDSRGGNIFVPEGRTLTLRDNVIISGGKTGTASASRGGNIFCAGTLQMYGGTIKDGYSGWGNNVMLPYTGKMNMYSGTISGGTGKSYGILNQRGTLKIYSGTVTDTETGYAAIISDGTGNTNGSNTYIYDGEIGTIIVNRKSNLYVLGGSVAKITEGSSYAAAGGTATVYAAVMQSDPAEHVASCSHSYGSETYTVWHPEGTCATCGHTFGAECATCGVTHEAKPCIHSYVEGVCQYCGKAAPAHNASCAHGCENVTWVPFDGLTVVDGGHYYLTEDMQLHGDVQIASIQVCIDLNGHTLTGPKEQRSFYMPSGTGVLSIMDSSADNTGTLQGAGYAYNANGAMVYVGDGNAFYLYNATITGGITTADRGANLYTTNGLIVIDNGKVTNGINRDGDACRGGNICLYDPNALLIMKGSDAKITGGMADGPNAYGGNIYCGSGADIVIYDGEISGGYAARNGANIELMNGSGETTRGLHYMYGGTIGDVHPDTPAGVSNFVVYGSSYINDFYVFGGHIQSMDDNGTNNEVKIYGGTFGFDPRTADNNVSSDLGQCACVTYDEATGIYTVVHTAGTGTCDICAAHDNGPEEYTVTYANTGSHSLVEDSVVAPNCTEQGYTNYTCSVCGGSQKGSFIDPDGVTHTYDDNGDCVRCDASVVAKVTDTEGNETWYATFTEALAFANGKGYTVKALKNVSEKLQTVYGASSTPIRNVTIDANPGVTITDTTYTSGTANYNLYLRGVTLTQNANLIVKCGLSVATGESTISGTTQSYTLSVADGAVLNINGTVTNDGNAMINGTVKVNEGGIWNANNNSNPNFIGLYNGAIEVNGGTINCDNFKLTPNSEGNEISVTLKDATVNAREAICVKNLALTMEGTNTVTLCGEAFDLSGITAETKMGWVSNSKSFQEATNYGITVTLVKNITLSSADTLNYPAIVNLNGFGLTGSIELQEGGSLTLVGENTGNLNVTTKLADKCVWVNEGVYTTGDHVYTYDPVTGAGTCASGCGATITCTHQYGEYTSNKDATCTADGTKSATCSVCGHVDTVTDEGSALGHDYEGVQTKAPTCTEDGETTYTCKHDPSHTYTEAINKLGHVDGDDADHTCDRDGCNEVVYDHSYTTTVTAPTCEQKGYTTYSCACGYSYTDNEVPALGHDYVGTQTKAPSCTEPGVMTYTCKNDASHTYTEEIKATGHTYVDHEAKAPTCTDIGWEAYQTCKNCDYTSYKEISAKGHAYEGTQTKAPSCTEPGVMTYTCKNDPSHTYTEEIKALGHTPVTDAAVAPTCTEPGLTEGSHCDVCGETLVAQKTAEALGHNYDANGDCIRCESAMAAEVTDTEGNETYYATFAEALAYANGKGYTVKALKNISEDLQAAYGTSGTALNNVIIDSNPGVTILDTTFASGTTDGAFFIKNVTITENVDFTVKCGLTVVSGESVVNGRTHSYILSVNTAGTLSINGTVVTDGNVLINNGTVNVNAGGTLDANTNGNPNFIALYNGAITVDGGTINCDNFKPTHRSNDTVSVTLKDATLNAREAICVRRLELTLEGTNTITLAEEAFDASGITVDTKMGWVTKSKNITDAAEYGLGLTLMADVALSKSGITFDYPVTIDQNGHTLTGPVKLAEGGSVTLIGEKTADLTITTDLEGMCAWATDNGDGSATYAASEHVIGDWDQGVKSCLNPNCDSKIVCEHNYTDVVTDPTCEAAGYTTHTCSICTYVLVDTPVDALGHAWSEWTDIGDAGHTRVCGNDPSHTEFAAHTYDPEVTAPNCTEPGFTTYTCACGLVYVDNPTDPDGVTHNFDDYGECTRCDASVIAKVTYTDGTVVYYTTFLEALIAANGTGATVKALKDVNEVMQPTFSTEDTSLDDVTIDSNPGVVITDTTDLTFEESSNHNFYLKKVHFTENTNFNVKMILRFKSGESVIDGTVSTYILGISGATLVVNGELNNTGNVVMSIGHVIVNEGAVWNANTNSNHNFIGCYGGTIEINGGTVNCDVFKSVGRNPDDKDEEEVTGDREARDANLIIRNGTLNAREAVLIRKTNLTLEGENIVTLNGEAFDMSGITYETSYGWIASPRGFLEANTYNLDMTLMDNVKLTKSQGIKISRALTVQMNGNTLAGPLELVEGGSLTLVGENTGALKVTTNLEGKCVWITTEGETAVYTTSEHIFGDWVDGIQYCENANCSATIGCTHNYVSVVTDPTCEEIGYTTHTCTICNYSYTDATVAALEHNYGAWIDNGDGSHSHICANDPSHIETEAHTHSKVITAPNCTEQGYTTFTCTGCGYSYVGDYVDADGVTHDFDDYGECTRCDASVIAKVTYKDGTIVYYETFLEALVAANNTGATVKALKNVEEVMQPTFGDIYAPLRNVTIDCNPGVTIKDITEIPTNERPDHAFYLREVTFTENADFTVDMILSFRAGKSVINGKVSTYILSMHGVDLTINGELNNTGNAMFTTGHVLITETGVWNANTNPDITNFIGLYGGTLEIDGGTVNCDNFKAVGRIPGEAETESVTRDANVIIRNGTVDARYAFVARRLHLTMEGENTITVAGHEFDASVITYETANGWVSNQKSFEEADIYDVDFTLMKNIKLSETVFDRDVIIDQNGYTLTGPIKLAEGGSVTLIGEKAEKLTITTDLEGKCVWAAPGEGFTVYTTSGHVLGQWTDNGENHKKVCTNCGGAEVFGDHEDTVEVTAPTCEAAGYTTHTCTICGRVYTDAPTDALGHAWSSWADNGDGTHTRICGNDETHIETGDHTYEFVVTAPNCTEQGYTTFTCTGCGYSYVGNYVDADGVTHDFDEFGDCTRCDASVIAKVTYTDGTVEYYTTFLEALVAAQNTGATVKALKNVNEVLQPTFSTDKTALRNVIIDCNPGVTITDTTEIPSNERPDHTFYLREVTFTENATFTVNMILHFVGKSEVSAVNGNVTTYILFVGDADLQVNGILNNTGNVVMNSGSITINEGGTWNANTNANVTNFIGVYGGTVNINGGTVNCDNFKPVGSADSDATVIIRNGTLNAEFAFCARKLHLTLEGENTITVAGHAFDASVITYETANGWVSNSVSFEEADKYNLNFTLMGDIKISETAFDRDVIIDQNGYTLTGPIKLAEGGTVTLIGEKAEKLTITTDLEGKCVWVATEGETAVYTTSEHVFGQWTDNGENHKKVCTNCGTETFGDHEDTVEVTAPTCETAGYTTHTCTICGRVYTDAPTDALGHAWGDWSNDGDGNHSRVCGNDASHTETAAHSIESAVTPPTFDAQGYTTHTCTVCKYSYVDSYVDALVAVAMVGDTKYTTLQAALQAASDAGGGTVHVLISVTETWQTEDGSPSVFGEKNPITNVTITAEDGVTININSYDGKINTGAIYINNVTFDTSVDFQTDLYLHGNGTVNINGAVSCYIYGADTASVTNVNGTQGGKLTVTGNLFLTGGNINVYGDGSDTVVLHANSSGNNNSISMRNGTLYVENATVQCDTIFYDASGKTAPAIVLNDAKMLVTGTESKLSGEYAVNMGSIGTFTLNGESTLDITKANATVYFAEGKNITLSEDSTVITAVADLQNANILAADGVDGCVYYADGAYTVKAHNAAAATCTQDSVCTNCNKVVATATGHTYVDHEAKAPTCTDIGWEAYQTCENCDYTTYVEISAKGHEYDSVYTEPTVSTNAYTTYTCKNGCGHSYVVEHEGTMLGVAQNAQTGVIYGDPQVALNEAQKGQTVLLLANVTVDTLFVGAGKTLNLNGKTLTVNTYITASFKTTHIVDTSAAEGLIVLAEGADIAFNTDNSYLPVKTAEGWKLLTVAFLQALDYKSADWAYYRFAFVEEQILLDQLLKNGTEGTGISIRIKVSYITVSGMQAYQYFEYTDEMVKQYYNYKTGWQNAAFRLNLTGVADLSEMLFSAEIVSKTPTGDVVIGSTPIAD